MGQATGPATPPSSWASRAEGPPRLASAHGFAHVLRRSSGINLNCGQPSVAQGRLNGPWITNSA